MLNYNMPSSLKTCLIFIFAGVLAASCSPIKEKLQPKALVEMDYVDPELVKQNSNSPDHAVVGNLSYEVQKDLSTDKTNIYASASFHEPTAKNVLFDKIRTNELNKNVYKPKPPVDQPCGIPGFPDCTTPGNPTPPPTNPDHPCGIPGFPDCPTKPVTLIKE